ncbi:MAG: hypothetical protein R3191_05100 [Anaerolineales bacterium]|nr:hypothetical protein [Anaerolineales bacterium]
MHPVDQAFDQSPAKPLPAQAFLYNDRGHLQRAISVRFDLSASDDSALTIFRDKKARPFKAGGIQLFRPYKLVNSIGILRSGRADCDARIHD